jgi:hypothetical protein
VYKSRLLIYDAGEGRTSWISFWKALALLQCGTTMVFFVPPLWKNENQPDVNLRQAQAVLGEFSFFPMSFICRSVLLVSSFLLLITSFHYFSFHASNELPQRSSELSKSYNSWIFKLQYVYYSQPAS